MNLISTIPYQIVARRQVLILIDQVEGRTMIKDVDWSMDGWMDGRVTDESNKQMRPSTR